MAETVQRLAAIMVLLGFAGLGSGCLALAAAGATGASVAYVEGNSENLLRSSPDRVIAATMRAFHDLGITLTGQSHDRDEPTWQLKGHSPGDKSVKVTIRRENQGVSRVWVRVGFFGDQQYGNTILTRIKQRLRSQAPSPRSGNARRSHR